MSLKIKILLLFAFSLLCLGSAVAQTEPTKPEEDEFASKKVETKITAVVETDSLEPGELNKRAVNWIKKESPKYKKSSGTTNGNKIECLVSFPVKPKELNPQVDYTGKVTMKLVIECKQDKYRYTISDIKHTSKSGNTTGGSVDNIVPECGSMAMTDLVWKKLKGEALSGAALIVAELKDGMTKDSAGETGKEEW